MQYDNFSDIFKTCNDFEIMLKSTPETSSYTYTNKTFFRREHS